MRENNTLMREHEALMREKEAEDPVYRLNTIACCTQHPKIAEGA